MGVVNAKIDGLEVVDPVVTISDCPVQEAYEDISLAVVVKDPLCSINMMVMYDFFSGMPDSRDGPAMPTSSLIISEGMVDIPFSIISNEELKTHLGLVLHDSCVNQSDWLDEPLSSLGEGEGEELEGVEEEFNAMFNLNVNRIAKKTFSHGGGKQQHRKPKRKVFSCLIVLFYLDGCEAGKAAKTPPPLIQSVVFASKEAHIRDQNPSLNKWLWLLRDVIDEADDVLDEFDYKQLNIKERLIKFGKRALYIDFTLKKLEVVVKKLDEVSVDVDGIL
ncbi:hypothetical protein M5K25_007011 [Dendrobium thyrsiflorum]|uniref:Disease resistance N-terminal domain-containing protein n=1 Tax=Dendrobium thyrsiflorum TaxID=117978 RepID=A0ABD0VD15_DENTH